MRKLFSDELGLINVGISFFYDDMKKQGAKAIHLEWTPPAGGEEHLMEAHNALDDEETDISNRKAVDHILAAQPVLVDIAKALDVIPGMTQNTILHSGPPIAYENMCGAMQGAVTGALLYEGMAQTVEEADQVARSGRIHFAPCHEHQAVGPMAGIISPSMPVHVVVNRVGGNKAFATINEGLGKVLRYGANDREVIERLKRIETVIAPALKKVLSEGNGIDLKMLIAQGVQMGDECHNRNKATTALFFREIAQRLLANCTPEEARDTMQFVAANEHYFLNLSMAACKCALDTAQGVPGSTIVTAMARNGVEFGLRISGLPGQWFTGPANMVRGLLFPGFKQEDCNLDIGDSAITETMGIGGFAMAAAPAIVQFVGGTVSDAIEYSTSMYTITTTENSSFSLPTLDFRGSALGIDVRMVIATKVLPIINTGIAHRLAGVGQVGAGLVNPPMECFEKAILALAKTREK